MPNFVYNTSQDALLINSLIESPSLSSAMSVGNIGELTNLSVKSQFIEDPTYTKTVTLDKNGNLTSRQFIEWLPITDGLVLWYGFDENSGTIAYDNSGNGHVGTLAGTPSWTVGRIRDALAMNNVGYVSTPDTSSLGITGDLTIASWINMYDPNNYYALVSKSNSSTLNGAPYSLLVWFGNPVIFLGNGTGGILIWVSSVLIPSNVWQHLCVTKSGPNNNFTVNFYLNGVNVASYPGNSTTMGNQSVPLYIGHRQASGAYSENLNGIMDDVRIYNIALSVDEIILIYNLEG